MGKMIDATEQVAEILNELARHKRLVRVLRDRSNWTRDGRWSPLVISYDRDIIDFIDRTLKGNINEDQPKLPV